MYKYNNENKPTVQLSAIFYLTEFNFTCLNIVERKINESIIFSKVRTNLIYYIICTYIHI